MRLPIPSPRPDVVGEAARRRTYAVLCAEFCRRLFHDLLPPPLTAARLASSTTRCSLWPSGDSSRTIVRAGRIHSRTAFGQLTGNPMGARACGHTQPQKLAAGMLQDQKPIQQPKRDRRDYEQIHRGEAVGMIAQKGLPALRRTSADCQSASKVDCLYRKSDSAITMMKPAEDGRRYDAASVAILGRPPRERSCVSSTPQLKRD
jgi:hypothetical protein